MSLAVGATVSNAESLPTKLLVYTAEFRLLKNVLANRNERALCKLVVDAANGRIVGAHAMVWGGDGSSVGVEVLWRRARRARAVG